MSEKLALVPADEKALAVAPNPVAEVGTLLQMAIKQGVTAENAAALEKLTDLYERAQDRAAKKDFVTALAEFQSECKSVKATKPVPDKQGNIKYHFADFEAIMNEVQPLAQKYGFVISFSSRADVGRITKICKLQHASGHSVESEYSVRIGSGPPGASETQADGAAHTYAKRGALCDALNIRIDKGFNDARGLGGKITKEQAESLRKRVHESGGDEVRFLKLADATIYEEIHEAKYALLDAKLRQRESTR